MTRHGQEALTTWGHRTGSGSVRTVVSHLWQEVSMAACLNSGEGPLCGHQSDLGQVALVL